MKHARPRGRPDPLEARRTPQNDESRAADHLGDLATARLADAPAGRQGDMPDGLINGPIKRSEGSDS